MKAILSVLFLLLAAVSLSSAQTTTTFSVSGGASISIVISSDAMDSINTAIANEQVPNAGTTLTASIISTDVSFALDSVTGLAVGNGLLMGTDIMLVTAISGTTVTVTRGTAGTTAAAHTAADPVIFLQTGDLTTWVKAKLATKIVEAMNVFPGATIAGAKSTIATAVDGAVN